MSSRKDFHFVTGAVARSVIAAAILDTMDETTTDREVQIGSITLHPRQIEAVHRIQAAFDEFGGALLCDPVGTGKTFVALALKTELPIVVVAPAVLRSMWTQSADLCRKAIVFYSMEALSRGGPDLTNEGDLLIVDEAHHVRNPATARYRGVSHLARSRRALLLTATPIHNSRRELNTLLSLFLGARATTLTSAQSGRCVIRRDSGQSSETHQPLVRPLEWLQVTATSSIPELLLALPPPLPPSDGGDGGILVAHSLIRQWMSSNAALYGGLTRRLHRSIALIAALEDGTYPSKEELRAWIGAGDSVQLAFSALLAAPSPEGAGLLATVNAHREAVSELRAAVIRDDSADGHRAELIRSIRTRHNGEKIVAFSQYADTVEAMFDRIVCSGHVAALTGRGGRVAGGTISRNDAIERFAPVASRSKTPPQSERIDLLLTTDLLSEGVNLQDASVVIHLDLPWTPARMEQRLGRIARLGSRHSVVHAYALSAPETTVDVVGIERILRRKMEQAGSIVNQFPSLTGAAFPLLTGDAQPQVVERVRGLLHTWAVDSQRRFAVPVIAHVRSEESGYVAACEVNGKAILVASRSQRSGESPAFVLECLKLCCADNVISNDTDAHSALARVEAYLSARRALDNAAATPASGDARRNALRRIARAERECRPHRRAAFATLASRARGSLSGIMGSAAEHDLWMSMRALDDDEVWMNHVASLDRWRSAISPASQICVSAGENVKPDRVIAIIVFGGNGRA